MYRYKEIFSLTAHPELCKETVKTMSERLKEASQVEGLEGFDDWYTEAFGKGDALDKDNIDFKPNNTYKYYANFKFKDETPTEPDDSSEEPETPTEPDDSSEEPETPTEPDDSDAPIIGKAYNVSFFDADNTLLSSKLYAVGDTPSDTQARNALSMPYTYQFTGWDKNIIPVVDDAVYQAQYIQNIDDIKYTVNFYDDGILLNSQQVTYGGSATAPDDPLKEGYTFDGWDVSFDNIIKDTDVYAQWTENITEDGTYTIAFWDMQYNVVFKDYDGRIIYDKYYAIGDDLVAPPATRDGYYFDGWLLNSQKTVVPNKVFGDAEYVASYKRPSVTYYDYVGGKIIKTESVNVGGSSNYPYTPERAEYYIFDGWSKTKEELSNITEDIVVYGLWHIDTSALSTWTGAAHYNSNSLSIYGLDPNSNLWCPCCDDYGKSNLVVDGKSVPTIEWKLKSYVTTNAIYVSDPTPINGLVFNGTNPLYKTTKPDNGLDYACFAVGKNSSTTSWNGAGAGIKVGSLNGILPGENNDIVAFIRIYVQDEFENVGWDFHSCYGAQGISINKNGSGEINLINNLSGTRNLTYDDTDIPNGKLESGKLYVLYDTKQSNLGVRNLTDDDKKYLTETSFVTSTALRSKTSDVIICSIDTPEGNVSRSLSISELETAGVTFNMEDSTYDAPIDTEILDGALKYEFTTDCILSIDATISNPYVFKAGTAINIAYYSGCSFIKYVR